MKIIFIVGMHRCGTSVLSSYIETLGYKIGKNRNSDKDIQNLKGYWENDTLTAFHNEMLKYNGCIWSNVDKINLKYTKAHVKKYCRIVKNQFRHNKILIKDPRLSFFFHFMKEVGQELNADIKILFSTRNKEECLLSLSKAQKIDMLSCEKLFDLTQKTYRDEMFIVNYNNFTRNNISMRQEICLFINEYDSGMNTVDMELYRNRKLKPKLLTVLLFHNDEDLVEDQIKYYHYLNKQDLIVFSHNSTDKTNEIINSFSKDIRSIYYLNEEVSFKDNKVHEFIYETLVGKITEKRKNFKINDIRYIGYDYSEDYDWISFPESDEFLEGPNREKSFLGHLEDVHLNPKIDKIIYSNIVYWFTEKDDLSIKSPVERIRHYSYKKDCSPRLYSWRSKNTIIRNFGHISKKDDLSKTVTWKSRHYEIRSLEHFEKKIKDRVNITKNNGTNHHYKLLRDRFFSIKNYGIINSKELNFDNGHDEINMDVKYDWKKIY